MHMAIASALRLVDKTSTTWCTAPRRVEVRRCRGDPSRSVARVVFPTDGDLDVLPLYVDGQQVPVPVEDR